MRRLDRWRAILALGPVQAWLKRRVDRSVPGPDAEQRERTPVLLWAEGRNAAGRTVVGRLRVANGYTTTVHASLGIVERILRGATPTGYRTPSQVVGADFVSGLPGSTVVSIGGA
jgi:short subunit dehydrogenase-like uncharacterized protein